jgi:sensor domain CHASE-containing protein
MKKGKLIYNVILHILAIIGAIIFFTSCNDSERDKQRAEQKKITQAIERKIDSLQRQNESDKLWRNQ